MSYITYVSFPFHVIVLSNFKYRMINICESEISIVIQHFFGAIYLKTKVALTQCKLTSTIVLLCCSLVLGCDDPVYSPNLRSHINFLLRLTPSHFQMFYLQWDMHTRIGQYSIRDRKVCQYRNIIKVFLPSVRVYCKLRDRTFEAAFSLPRNHPSVII